MSSSNLGRLRVEVFSSFQIERELVFIFYFLGKLYFKIYIIGVVSN